MNDQNYTATHVAYFFITRAQDEKVALTQMQLMKLVYIGYGWVLAVLDRKLFDEPVEAWQHGPVIESLYHTFKHFGASPITTIGTEFDLDELDVKTPQIDHEDKDARVVLEKVWEVYKHFTANALRSKTHEGGTPWSEVYQPGQRSIQIPAGSIQKHFINKINGYLNV